MVHHRWTAIALAKTAVYRPPQGNASEFRLAHFVSFDPAKPDEPDNEQQSRSVDFVAGDSETTQWLASALALRRNANHGHQGPQSQDLLPTPNITTPARAGRRTSAMHQVMPPLRE